jgi:hypothetical protein
MSEVGDAINEVRAEVNADVASEVLPDLCDIIQIELVSDGHSGQTEGESPAATNVPVEIAEATPSNNTIVAGDVTYTGSHRLKFGWNATTTAINPKQLIKVHARGSEKLMVFEKPIREHGGNGPWLFVLVTLTTGFRSPPTI